MTLEEKRHFVPSWDGDAGRFADYCEECRWYRAGLKKDDRVLVVARLRPLLTGPARRVAKKMSVDEYAGTDGLEKYLEFLGKSPLGMQPLPDAFQRIDRYDSILRHKGESMPDYIVREDEAFSELQASLTRVRQDRAKKDDHDYEEEEEKEEADPPMDVVGFFDNEMRGYKLLKGALLDHGERQAILAMTRNSTEYLEIGAAIKGSWEPDELKRRDDEKYWHVRKQSEKDKKPPETGGKGGRAYFEDGWWDDTAWQDDWYDVGGWCDHDDEWHEAPASWTETGAESQADTGKEDEELTEKTEQLKQVEALAADTQRTLQEARAAVARARQSRGFYDGKGGKKGGGKKGGKKGKTGGKKGGKKGKGGKATGCMICGSGDHWWRDCPDRHSKGKGKGYYIDEWDPYEEWWSWNYAIFVLNFSAGFLYHMGGLPGSFVVIDTGATESAGGLDAVTNLIASLQARWPDLEYWVDRSDRPWFKYASGEWGRAASRVHAQLPVGMIAVYTLEADTPVLFGSDLLDMLGANLCYHTNKLTLKKVVGQPVVSVDRAPSGHRLLDVGCLPEAGSDAAKTAAAPEE